MRVLHASAEIYPWVKSGGLGDVAAALPPALIALGADIRLLLPGFAGFLDAFARMTDVVRLATPFAAERVRVVRANLPGSGRIAYLVDHPAFYDRPGNPYAGPDGSDWPDNHRRFGLFGWLAAALARGADADWRPDLLHCHDWHAGLAPAYLAATPPPDRRVRTIFTIHNLAYRGEFPGARFAELALPPEFFAVDGVEFFGGVSFLKAGLFYADRLTTVSPTYAREIETPAFGSGLDGLLRSRSGALSGILNGVDPTLWDPRRDANLPQGYGLDDAATGKRPAKQALQRRLGLEQNHEALLLGVVSRLTPQKGLDLLLPLIPELVSSGHQLALLGSGDIDLERGLVAAAQAYGGHVAVALGYDEALSHLIIGGADLLVMPSRFEPCGLTQLYALRYGTLPLVRRVGGLADTVVDADALSLADGTATGFAFDEESAPGLGAAIERAAVLFRQPQLWQSVMRRAMTRDFSWEAAARRYLALYRELCPQAAGADPAVQRAAAR
jgi:starch synthase